MWNLCDNLGRNISHWRRWARWIHLSIAKIPKEFRRHHFFPLLKGEFYWRFGCVSAWNIFIFSWCFYIFMMFLYFHDTFMIFSRHAPLVLGKSVSSSQSLNSLFNQSINQSLSQSIIFIKTTLKHFHTSRYVTMQLFIKKKI